MDILHKLKQNLGQEHVKRGALCFQGMNRNNFPYYPCQNDIFPVLSEFFHHPSLASPPKQNSIFEISDNRAILKKFHNVILKIVNFVAIWVISIFGWNLAIFSLKTPLVWGVDMVTK